MSKNQDIKFLKTQTCILKVNIHCDGCKQKVKKLLQKIDDVYTINIDAEQGKVTVSGNVDPATLIKKLGKAGKHAEILFPKGKGGGGNQLNGQIQKSQLDNGKGGKGGSGGNHQKGHQPNPQQQQQLLEQQLKAFNLNLAQLKGAKDPRAVKFALPEDEEGSDFDDEFDDEFDDDDYDDLDCWDDDLEEDIGGGHKIAAINVPLVVNEKKGGGGGGGGGNTNKNSNSGKKGGGDVHVQGKGAGGGNEAKNGGGNKKGGGGGGGGNQKQSSTGGAGGGGPQEGKSGGNNKAAANSNKKNNNHDGNGKAGGGKQGGGHPTTYPAMMPQMANVNMPMGGIPMGRIPAAVQGLPAGGGITPEMLAAANPYQQQYLAAMMQQQRMMMMNGQDRSIQAMAYARPPPAVAYMPPPPDYTHLFSDENTGSCSIM